VLVPEELLTDFFQTLLSDWRMLTINPVHVQPPFVCAVYLGITKGK
jgi:hypothetical protein